ncbi:uncharacterized protein HD556DRAFT_1312927 [Suillus plorans]|uniref:KOW domain-containing protein n=1 Tax=Suillus plorans TaxID=116603 RepID=A0A9P7DCG4_9AGAM|nr:uncharacterized protein HD556DRAFT_1312927 [Suillus plorans]KAG1787212.1 hypothetical protein HD556DRAFT_1312927 [Suillus plorans]
MSKRAGSSGAEPTPKRHKGNPAVPSALYDNGAWKILEQFLTTSMSLSEMDNVLVAYLGDQYSADDWVEPRRLLFSGDANDDESLRNLSELRKTNIPCEDVCIEEACSLAEVGDEEEEKEEEGYDEYGDGMSVRSPKVTCLPGLSAKQRLAATFDEMATRFGQNPATSLQSRQAPTHRALKSRMYLLHIQRAVTEYIAEYLRRKKFPVTVSAWLTGQLYVVADSPKTIADTLPSSLYLAIKHKYKGYIGRVFKSRKDIVEVLCPPHDFPYPMPRGCRVLVERSRLPKNNLVSDIILHDEVVGWTYKGESYYKGLLLKKFLHDHLELLASPHADTIQLHLESGWDTAFLKKTVVEFSMQLLRIGDWARITNGALHGALGRVISTDHACGSVGLEIDSKGHPDKIEFRLQDIEYLFRIGNTVRVVAGPYLGLEGYIIKMCGEVFYVEVSKYYLDQRPLRHTIKSQLPVQQHLAPSPESDCIEIWDFIQVLDRKHIRKHSIVDWISKGESTLWFRDIITPDNTGSGLSSILVPTAMVQVTDLAQTIQYTKERGYDVRPGDTINIKIGFTIKLHNDIGQEVFVIGGDRKGYQATLYSLAPEICMVAVHGQQRTNVKLHDVVTRYGMRLSGVILEGPEMILFCEMRKRSYLAPPAQSITPPVEIAPSASTTSITDSPSSLNSWAPWSASPGDVDVAHDPSSSTINPSSSTSDPWTVDNQESIGTEKLPDRGPLSWLMTKEFSSKLFNYHMVLKISPSFMGGRLNKQFVFTACPDPFCGENGPAPKGSVAALCTSNGAGATIKHYHIPMSDLSPAPPRKKNQDVLILDREHRGLIQTIVSCYNKGGVVKITITPTVIPEIGTGAFVSLLERFCGAEQNLVTHPCTLGINVAT